MGDMTVMQKQEVARGAQAIGAIVGRQARRKAEKLTSPLPTLSFWGKVLSVTAFAAALAFAGLAVLDSSHIVVNRGQAATVARDTVNVRQGSSTGSGIVMKARMGDRFTVVGSKGTWTKVRSTSGNQGWIASSLMDTRTAKTLNLNYEMKGYFTALLICMAIVFFALRMKKVAVPAAGRKGNETMLVDMDK
jgi:uncharacterized protein YraI